MSGFESPNNMLLKIELEHIKTSVRTMLQNRSNEMQQMVAEALERTINEDWVQASINHAVKSVVNDAIDDITKNYKLKQAIAELIDDAVVKMVRNTKIE